MLKVVVDTNLFVRGLLKGKTVLSLFVAFKNKKFQLVISTALLAELIDVLGRKRLKKYFTVEEVGELITFIEKEAIIVESNETIKDCRDVKDNIVLECAISAKADYIVTADVDLLVLNPYRKTKIVSPQEFMLQAFAI